MILAVAGICVACGPDGGSGGGLLADGGGSLDDASAGDASTGGSATDGGAGPGAFDGGGATSDGGVGGGDGGLAGADGGDAAISAPEIVEWFPEDGATEVPVVAAVRLTFSQAMDRAATELAFSMVSGGVPVAGTFSWIEGDRVLVFMPSAELTAGTSYMVTVGPEAVDLAGNSLDTTFTIGFTTALEPGATKAVWDDFLWDVDNWQ